MNERILRKSERIKILEARVKLLLNENGELKDVLNDIVNTIHEHIEIKMG